MKYAFIGDLHFGARNNSRAFLNYFKEYFDKELFPYLLDNNIKHVFQLGDTLDKRKSVDFTISNFLTKYFFNFFQTNQIQYYTLLGNHDIYYKDTLEISGMKQYTGMYPYIHIISEPTQIEVPDVDIIMVPWVCEENKEAITNYLENYQPDTSKKHFLLGHFELSGFLINKSFISEHDTLARKPFDKFDNVLSGHYHTPSHKDNITYIGTPYQLTWNDYGDIKKVLIYDTDSKEFSELVTQTEMFHTFVYNNDIHKDFNYDRCKNSYIKIIIIDDITSHANFDFFLSELESKSAPLNIQIIDNREESVQDDIIIDIENPFDILVSTIENEIKDESLMPRIKKIIHNIHVKAIESQKGL